MLNAVWEAFRWNVVEAMNEAPDVRWDRVVQYADKLRVYGWTELGRDDGRSDFVLLDFVLGDQDGEPVVSSDFLTSNAGLSTKLAEEAARCGVEGEHTDCERVEHLYGTAVPNAIRLAP